MNKDILFDISAGMYILSTKHSACFVDAVMQISSDSEPLICVSVMNDNYTNKIMKEEDYFIKNLPCVSYYETVNLPVVMNAFSKICYNNTAILNSEFKKKKFYKENFLKILNLKNGMKHIIQSLFLLPYPMFCGIGIVHGGSPMLKSNYFYLWDKYYSIFHNTCLHKFRNYDLDINQYVIKDYQTLTGNYYVRRCNFVKLINVESREQLSILKKTLNDFKNKELCVNDGLVNEKDCNDIIRQVQEIFEEKFSDKCSLEKSVKYAKK